MANVKAALPSVIVADSMTPQADHPMAFVGECPGWTVQLYRRAALHWFAFFTT